MAILVVASGLYRLLARKMRGYADAQANRTFRDLVDMPATVTVAANEIIVRFLRRAHLPILIDSGLLDNPGAGALAERRLPTADHVALCPHTRHLETILR